MKAVLLGMNNPVSSNPKFALYPYPPGCTGARILKLLQRRLPDVGRREYLEAFDRTNLLSKLVWNKREAQDAAITFLKDVAPGLRGRTVVVFGAEVRKLLGLEEKLIEPIEMEGVVYRQLPHPSGRNYWYNVPECADLAAILLEELYEGASK